MEHMLPDEIEQLQKLLLKFNQNLNVILKPNILKNLNGLTHFNDFVTDLNQVIEANKTLLETDWYMNLFQLRKKL